MEILKSALVYLERAYFFFNSDSVLHELSFKCCLSVTWYICKHHVLGNFLYLLCLCPFLDLSLFMSYLCNLFSISSSFLLWLIVYFNDYWHTSLHRKMKFSIFSKCDQICSFLRIWSHLLRKSFMENFIFCAVSL